MKIQKKKSRRRLFYNVGIFGAIAAIWVLYFIGFPFIGIKTSIGFSIVMLGIKLYDDRAMGITAYGERKDALVITEEYLEVRGVTIPYADVTNLVIYVDEHLGKPREIFGVHHGGNNEIKFTYDRKMVSIHYVIKNKQDYERVSRLVSRIEKNPSLQKNLAKLN